MSQQTYTVRNAYPNEFTQIGKLMVQVYSQLDGFPTWHFKSQWFYHF